MAKTGTDLNITDMSAEAVAALISRHIPPVTGSGRQLIAVAGPPASGKSTIAAALVHLLNEQMHPTVLLPLDGFHMDNCLLVPRGLFHRKGAPETFDAQGFIATLKRVQSEAYVLVPTFDRDRDIAIANSAEIRPEHRTVVVEGNYLLLNEAPWTALAPFWDMQVFLDIPLTELRERLIRRWIYHGLSETHARARTEENDVPNALHVQTHKAVTDALALHLSIK